MNELLLFIKHFALYFWLCRVVLLFLGFMLFSGAIAIIFWENQTAFNAFYFVSVTALTIGYGDIVPVTVTGKIISIAVGIVGIICMGLLIAISTLTLRNTISIHKMNKN